MIAANAPADTITFGGTTPALSLSAGAGAATVSNGLVFSAATTITNNSSNSLTLSGVITGTGAVTEAGTGTLVLTAANTYTAATKINAGTMQLNFAADGAPASNILYNGVTPAALTLGSGTLAVVGNSSLTSGQTLAGLTLSGSGELSVTSGTGAGSTSVTLNAITHALGTTVDFTLTNPGTGTASIGTTTVNTTTGAANILGGYATVAGGGWAVTGTGSGPFNVTALAAGSYSSTFTANTDVNIATSQSPSAFTTVSTLRFNPASPAALTLTLTGVNTLNLGGILVTPAVGANVTKITGGTSIGATTGQDLIFQQFNTTTSLTASELTVATPIATASGQNAIKAGPGMMVVSSTTNTTTFLGNWDLNGGVLQVGAVTTVGATSATVTFNGGTINLTATYSPGTDLQKWTFGAGGGTVNISSGITATRTGGSLFGSGTMTLTGPGLLAVGSDTSTFTGSTVVNAGTIRFTSSQFGSAGNMTINSGGTYLIDDNATNANWGFATGSILTLNGSGTGSFGAFGLEMQGSTGQGPQSTFKNNIVLQTSSVFTPTNGTFPVELILGGTVTGPGNLTMNGNGTLVLKNAGNTYGGANGTTTAAGGGFLTLGVTNALPTSTSLILGNSSSSGTFDMAGFNQTIAGLSIGTGASAASQVIGSSLNSGTPNTITSTLTFAGNATASTFGGTIQDTLTVTSVTNVTTTGNQMVGLAVSAGSLTLAGTSNTYSGGTSVTGGTLNIAADGSLGNPSTSTTINGGTLQFGGSFGLVSTRNILLGTTGAIDTQAFSASIAGAINDLTTGGVLTKIGSGTLTLTGTNMYSGGTVVTPARCRSAAAAPAGRSSAT